MGWIVGMLLLLGGLYLLKFFLGNGGLAMVRIRYVEPGESWKQVYLNSKKGKGKKGSNRMFYIGMAILAGVSVLVLIFGLMAG